MGNLMTSKEVAEKLNIGVETVWRWIRDGDLNAVTLGKSDYRKEYRINSEDLERFLENRRKDK